MFKSYYRWVIFSISFVNIAATTGLSFCFSIFFAPIMEEFKWSRASIAGAFSLSTISFGISSWFGGRLVDRFGTRGILIGSVVFLSLATAASGLIHELWQLYFSFGVAAAIGVAGLGQVPNSVLLSNWFIQKRGTVMGIAFSGMGIGLLVIGPLSQFLISQFGWRTAYVLLGAALFVLLVPANFLVQNRPDGKETLPSEPKSRSTPKVPKKDEDFYSKEEGAIIWTLGCAMRTAPFWCLFFATFLTPLGIYPVMIHQVVYVIDLGYDRILAASVLGGIGLFSTVGRVLFGTLSDRIGRQQAITWSFACSIAGICILIFLPSLKTVYWLYLYAVLFGIGFGARGPILAAMTADLFRGRHLGSIYGFQNIGNGIGGALGPWLGGYLYDLIGNYDIAFLTCIPVLAMACMLYWIAGSPKEKKVSI